jgi:uncharacterized sulfatase
MERHFAGYRNEKKASMTSNGINLFSKNGERLVHGTLFLIFAVSCSNHTSKKPNILWITCEDISPHLGCYGDKYSYTPTLDKMASEGVLFRNAFSSASVSTPARSSIITGMYASCLGTQHLRGKVQLSKDVKCFTEYLRDAGYYCANFNKTDYNFDIPLKAWDFNGSIRYDSLVCRHLVKINKEMPFFCVINLGLTHQGQVRYGIKTLTERNNSLPPEARHDPDKVPVPPYYPNTSDVRINLAALHTQITFMDMQVKEIIKQLEDYGLDKNTIVVFFSDHGDGLPRHKRWLYHSGTRVPFIIKFPSKFSFLSPVKMGQEVMSVINFIDLAPTMLAIAGCEIPDMLPGKVFLGKHYSEREYTFSISDRVDEVYEFSRSVSDGHFQYIRNFSSDKPRLQWSTYSEITPIRKELRRLDKTNELDSLTGWLMSETKPVEELYDILADPYQIHDLSGMLPYKDKMIKMRNVLLQWMIDSRDLSLIPEPLMRDLSGAGSPKDVFNNSNIFPVERILKIADMKGRGVKYLDSLIMNLSDPSPILRYWAANGLSLLGDKANPAITQLKFLLKDKYIIVRIAAADALCKIYDCQEATEILGRALLDNDIVVRIYAAISLTGLKIKTELVKEYIEESLQNECTLIPDVYYKTYLKDALARIKTIIEE